MGLEWEGEEVGGVTVDTLSDATTVATVGTTGETVVDTLSDLPSSLLTTGTDTLG